MTLADVILEVLEANDGRCLDNEDERSEVANQIAVAVIGTWLPQKFASLFS